MQSDWGNGGDDVPQPMGCFSGPQMFEVSINNQTKHKVKVIVTPKSVRKIKELEGNAAVNVGAPGVSVGGSAGLRLIFDNADPCSQEVVIGAGMTEVINCKKKQAYYTVIHAEAPKIYRMNEPFKSQSDQQIDIPETAAFA